MAFWRQYLDRQFETRLSKHEAERHADTLAILILGITYTAQVDHGPEFPDIVRTPEFRLGVHDLVRVALPFCRTSACSPRRCEQSSSA
jgi:hypothetical protein